jgi:hypothetical protein
MNHCYIIENIIALTTCLEFLGCAARPRSVPSSLDHDQRQKLEVRKHCK